MTASDMTPLTGVSMTAFGVAFIRARESLREDRLYNDPYADAFVATARKAYLDPGAPSEAASRWTQIEQLVDQFYEGRTLGVRAGDDRAQAWVNSGGKQLVMLGAGLDTRPYRMDLPADLRWFELDLPEMFEFKEPVLKNVGATATCDRRVVPVDLRTDWVSPLLAAGFQPDVPTAWIDEGTIPYLSRDDATGVATNITQLSAPGSEFGTVRVSVDKSQPRYRDLKRFVADTGQQQPPVRGLGPDAEAWLERNGWNAEFRSWDEATGSYGRPEAMTGDPSSGSIHAVRRAD